MTNNAGGAHTKGATQEPTDPPVRSADSSGPDGPVLKIACGIIWVSDHISAAYWISRAGSRWDKRLKTRWQKNSVFYGYYVLAWLVLLLGFLIWAPISGNWGLVVGWLALYRLQDMLLGTIGEAFTSNPYEGSWASKVAVVIVNLVQVVTIFAIAFLVFTANNAFFPSVPPGRFDHFYLSWTSLPPLGSGITAETVRARILVIIESGAGVLLILIALSRFLGKPDTRGSLKVPGKGPPNRKTEAHYGRPISWVAVSIIIIGFITGGIAMMVGPVWWLFWVGAGIVVIGGIFALSGGILDDWY